MQNLEQRTEQQVLRFQQPCPTHGERPWLGGVAHVSSFEKQCQQRVPSCSFMTNAVHGKLRRAVAEVRSKRRHVHAVMLDVCGANKVRDERKDTLCLLWCQAAEHAARRGCVQQRLRHGRVMLLQCRLAAILRNLRSGQDAIVLE